MGAAAAIPGVVGGVAPGAFGAGVGTGLTAGGAGLAAGGAGLGSLGTGLAAGSALAGGAGVFSNFMAAAGPGLASGIGGSALTPALAAAAPAATSQALAPSLLQSAGLDALKTQAIGGGVLPGAGQGLASTLPGAVNPTLAQQIAQQQAVTNATRQQLLAQSGGTDVIGAATQKATTTAPKSIYDISTAPNAARYQSGLRPAASFVDDAGMAVADPRAEILGRSIRPDQNFLQNLGNISSFQDVKDYAEQHPYATSTAVGLGAMGLTNAMRQTGVQRPEDNAMIRPYTYERTQRPEAYEVSPTVDSSERNYFSDQFVAGEPYKATAKADGGIASAYAVGGPVEQMAALNAVGMNTGYPMAGINTPMYANPMMQRPEAVNVISPSGDAGVGAYSGEPKFAEGGETEVRGEYRYSYNPQTMQFTQLGVPERRVAIPNTGSGGGAWATAPQYKWEPIKDAGSQVSGGIMGAATAPMKGRPASAPVNIPEYQTPEQQLGLTDFYNMMNQQLAGYGGYGGYGGFAAGGGVNGESNLGSYSDGGRLLKGPGDGVSDSIPAVIGKRQPARLADGEFVVPARIVSELGNGSTEAGARKLYAMMDRIQKGRRKSVGKGKVAVDSKAEKHLPA